MGFDVSKLKDDPRIPDPDSSLVGRTSDVSSREEVDAGIPWPVDLNAIAQGRDRDGMLASRSLATLDNSLLRAFVGVPSRNTLEVARPGSAFGRGISALGDDPLSKTIAKFGSLAAAESQASIAGNASTMRGIVGSFRTLDPMKESARSGQSIHEVLLGKAAIKHAAEVERSFANQYSGNIFGLERFSEFQSFGLGIQVTQGFLRPYELPWKATLESIVNAPILNGIKKFAAGYAGLAQRIGDLFEAWRPKLDGFSEWLRREIKQWPQDPYGDLVPFWNVRLYRLAQAAYEGDYVARARFLDEIEANDAPDNVLIIGELLKPTFDPERLDRRVDWEQMDPAEARRWLRRRLDGLKLGAWKEEQERKNGELRYEVERQVIKASSFDAPELEFVEFELREDERALYDQLRGVLPEQQYWFCWYRTQGLKYEEIAAKMGLAVGTVKSHARLLKQNPSFLAVLGQ